MKKPSFQFDFKTRHAGISALITIAVLAGIIILNILAGELDIKADLTPRKLYSLSEDTLKLLDGLEASVEIIALYEPGQEPEALMQAVDEYDRHSRNISVRVIDPDRNPALIAGFTEGEDTVPRGAFIVSSGDQFRVIAGMDMYDISYGQQGEPQVMGQKVEQQITSAIAFVTTGFTPAIYEISGHMESSLASLGYGTNLTQANYVLSDVSLVLSDIPEDAALLTLIGPRTDLSEAEIGKLDRYLSDGGALMLALDLSAQKFINLYGLLRKWDIEVRHGLVMESRQNRLVAEFGDNPFVFAPYITDNETLLPLTEAKLNPVFQASLGFEPTSARQRQIEYIPLLRSSEDSRLRTDLSSELSSNPSLIPGDEQGPIDVAAAIRQRNMDTYEYEGAAIVALGSASTLGGLGYLGQIKANADMVMNLVNWAVGEEATVNIPSKSMYRLPLRIGNLTGIIYAALVIIIIPLICIGAAIVIHFRRRNK